MKTLFKYFILLFVLSSAVETFAQNIDSLKVALKNAMHDTTRCNILNELAEMASEEEWPAFNEQLLKLSKKNSTNASNAALKNFYLKFFAGALNNVGYVAQDEGNIPKALECYHKSLSIYEEMKDKRGVAVSLNNVASLYNEEDIPKALEYYYKSLKIYEDLQDKNGMAVILNNIGFIYDFQKDTIKALDCFRKTLKINEELKDTSGIAVSLNAIGVIYKSQGNTTKALECFLKSLKILREMRLKPRIAISLTNIAEMMVISGRINEAEVYAKEGFQLATELGYPREIRISAEILKRIYQKQRRFEEAFAMYALQIKMRDSTTNETTRKATYKQQIKYDYEQRETKLKAEQEKKDILAKAELKQKAQERNYFIIGFVLLLLLALFIFRSYRQKQKTNKLLDDKNQKITDSINYAKTIQNSILPQLENIQKHIPNSFVFYQPKDIVSGDFYWMQPITDKEVFFAVVDCTGHGVPGALLSMLSYSLLEQIVHQNKIYEPALILEKLNYLIEESFQKNKHVDSFIGGMDMALFKINYQNYELEYAGAANSLYIIRDKTLIELKANKKSIGLSMTKDSSFDTQKIKLQVNDCLYASTDGFVDQKGGEKGKKFLSHHFQTLLINLSSKNINEQRSEIEKVFSEWKGNREQIDDVLVFGMKI